MPRKVIHPEEAAFLTDPDAATSDHVKRLDIWLQAKARQGHPITAEAGNRLHDLDQRITGRSDFVVVDPQGDPDPTPPAPAQPEPETAFQRRTRLIRAAITARRSGGDAA
ncbi:hypothetical protein GCM10011415_02330 [Salipiger pallidus]|uniref:Uncharacterized protein n=1 Tax=Salipiger pallidus TaxID=1775170 RepID=A0A8J2ZGF7_9RHOB|nr:hypothetical protein [Salipiger pallidus]GGG59887.1 hypothetical protein GCM10011415_02330 [Salipiger pallidus]